MSDTDPYAPVLPRAVREQVERANQLAREAGIANVPPAPEGSAPSAEGANDGITTEVSPPEAPVDSTAPQSEPQPESSTPPAPAEIDWEARYNTLQGKYNTELPELRNQLRGLQDMLATMNARQHNYAAPEPPSSQDIPPTVNGQRPGRISTLPIPQADVESYGQELIDASQRWAEARFAPMLQDYERRLAQIEGNSQQLYQLNAAQQVERALDGAVPNWRQINVDPDFTGWLAQLDPFSGQSRKTLITDAYGSGDAARTIAFFQAYLREQTAVSPPSPGIQPGQTGNGGMSVGPAATLPLEALAVPGRGQVAAPPASGAPGRRTWSAADIAVLYDQQRRGMWRGREAEFGALERDMITAQAEGRYRQ